MYSIYSTFWITFDRNERNVHCDKDQMQMAESKLVLVLYNAKNSRALHTTLTKTYRDEGIIDGHNVDVRLVGGGAHYKTAGIDAKRNNGLDDGKSSHWWRILREVPGSVPSKSTEHFKSFQAKLWLVL